jgi:hypothetical protein
MSASQQRGGKQAWLDLVGILPYIEIDGKITESSVQAILEKLDVRMDRSELKVKGIWHMFKQFHVYNMEQPLFFIKELWQPECIREIFGLHMGIHFFDPELCPRKYLFGVWKQEAKKEKPILITTYVKGQPLKKNQFESHEYNLGRQYALHQVLSLYDVDWRHFIVQQGILVRIDFGKSFANITMPYQGFWDLKWNELKGNPAFRDGVDHEYTRLKANIAEKKRHIAFLIEKLEAIGAYQNFFIDFNIKEFLSKLRNYWTNYLPFPVI